MPASTVSLRRFDPPLALEVRPLARLEADGRLVPESAAWLPPIGPSVLILWRPGPQEPAFSHAYGHVRRVGRGWRFEAEPDSQPVSEGAFWVVHAFATAQRPRHKA